MKPTIERLTATIQQNLAWVNGFATVRLTIAAEGTVTAVQFLCDRLLPMTPDAGRVDAFRQAVTALLSEARFPPADGPTQLTLPVVVAG